MCRTGKISCNDIESDQTEGNGGINENQMCADVCDIGLNAVAHENISCNIINSPEKKGNDNSTDNVISEDVGNVRPNEADEYMANDRNNAAEQLQDVGNSVDAQTLLQENKQTENEGQYDKQKLGKVKEVRKESERHLVKTRFNRVKIFGPTNIVNRKMENVMKAPIIYCLCNGTYDGKSKMIQCDNCKNWYHYSCLNVPDCIPTTEERSVFFCGVGSSARKSSCSYQLMERC